MFKKVATASIGLVFLASPIFASALSADVQAKIDALLLQIKELQALIVQLQSGSQTTTCANLSRTLAFGSSGSDVKNLQNYLIAKGYLTTGYNTGYYGSLTMDAVGKMQLTLRIASTFGDAEYKIVGSRTRAVIGCDTTGASIRDYTIPGTVTLMTNQKAVAKSPNGDFIFRLVSISNSSVTIEHINPSGIIETVTLGPDKKSTYLAGGIRVSLISNTSKSATFAVSFEATS